MIYHFDTQDARAYGTDEAILLYNVVGWLRLNKAEGRNQFDGRTWTYNTARALVDVFDNIWSEDQIRRLLNKLTAKGILKKGNYNREVGRRADDRTLWLALEDETRILLPMPGRATRKSKENSADATTRSPAEPPANSPEASGESESRLPQNRRTPDSNSPDASGEFAGHIIVQKETFIGKTESEKPHKTLNVGAADDEKPNAAPPPSEPAATLNASSEDFANLLFQEESMDALLPGHAAPVTPARPPGGSGLANRPPAPPGPSLKEVEVGRVVAMTGDESSRKRWEQVYDLAEAAGLLILWDKARLQTYKAVLAAQKDGSEINPGRYFNALAARLLNEARPGLIPVGTRAERKEIQALARSSLAAAGQAEADAQSRPSSASPHPTDRSSTERVSHGRSP